MTSAERRRLVDDFGRAMQAYQRAVDELDQRAAEHLGLNRTDMRCLELVLTPDAEPRSPTELAAAAGLTTGGVTTAIDRLERAGYVVRERDAADRRRVTVRPTPRAERAAAEIYGPIVTEGEQLLAGFGDEVLAAMARLLEGATRQHLQHARRLSTRR